MRISEEVRNKLIKLSRKFFGEESHMTLFGSRVYDYKKGGDIDLFVETDQDVSYKKEIDFLVAVEKTVTTRKVDLVLSTPFRKSKPIFKTAKEEGVSLC